MKTGASALRLYVERNCGRSQLRWVLPEAVGVVVTVCAPAAQPARASDSRARRAWRLRPGSALTVVISAKMSQRLIARNSIGDPLSDTRITR